MGLHTVSSFLQELNSLIEINELDTTVDSNLGVLERVHLHVKVLNYRVV